MNRSASAPSAAGLLVLAILVFTGCSRNPGSDPTVADRLSDLADTTPETRIAAARELGMARERAAVQPLIRLLGDIRLDVRKSAARALGRIGDSRAVTALRRLLEQEDADPELRRLCAAALGAIGDTAAIPVLAGMLESSVEGDASAAAYALGRLGEPSRAVLMKALASNARQAKRAAAAALAAWGKGSRETMRGLVDHPDPMLRLTAAEYLAAHPRDEDADRIVNLLMDSDEIVRRSMPRVVARLGVHAVPSLTRIIEKTPKVDEKSERTGESPDTGLRSAQMAAIDLLVRHDGVQVVPVLVRALARGQRGKRARLRKHLLRQLDDPHCRVVLFDLLCRAGSLQERQTAFSLLWEWLGPRLAVTDDVDARKAVIEEAGFGEASAFIDACAAAMGQTDSTAGFHASLLLCTLGNALGRTAVEKQFRQDIEIVRRAAAIQVKKGSAKRAPQGTKEARNRAGQCLKALSGVADKAFVDSLLPLLSESGAWSRRYDGVVGRVVAVIEQAADPSYSEPLLAFVERRRHVNATARAAKVLGGFGEKRAFDAILRFVLPLPNDQYFVTIRRNAYEGLLGCDRERAYVEIGAVFKGLEARNLSAMASMLDLYRAHPDRAVIDPLMHWINHDIRSIREDCHATLIAMGRQELGWLIEAFETPDASRRRTLAGVIAEGFGREAVPGLLAAAGDRSARRRQGAVWALGCIGGERAAEKVKEAFEDEHEGVRSAALWSAGELRDPSHVPAMIGLLRDPHPAPRAMAARQLGRMGSVAAVQPLIGVLECRDSDVRFHAVLSLAALRASDARGPIRALLDDANPDVREAAAYARKIIAEP